MKPTTTKPVPSLKDADVKTHSLKRRAFMKALGGSSFLLAAGAASAGCGGRRSDTCRTTVDRDPFDASRTTCDGD